MSCGNTSNITYNNFGRRGLIKFSKELYESDSTELYFSLLNMKVYRIEYQPFDNSYKILFTSPFLPEGEVGTIIKEYTIESNNGLQFKEIG